MSAVNIVRHECDECGKQFCESEGKWLPCGGKDNWVGFRPLQLKATASWFYSATPDIEFCSYDCAINWLQTQKKKETNG